MNVLMVRLTPWAAQRILRNHTTTNRLSKTALRKSLDAMPDTEFHTVGQMQPKPVRAGAVVTTREAADGGWDMMEVRNSNDHLLAAIYLTDGKVRVS